MNRHLSEVEGDRVDAAFNRVLDAEAAARDWLAACRREALALIADAEERARRIGERAEARMVAVHDIADAGVARAVAQMLADDTELERDRPDAQTQVRLEQAIVALVEEMLDGTR